MKKSEKAKAVEEFEEQLNHFIYYEVHSWKFEEMGVDLMLAQQILYMLTSSMINNCVEFVFDGEDLHVYQDCYDCGRTECYILDLPDVLKKFKKIWRRGL